MDLLDGAAEGDSRKWDERERGGITCSKGPQVVFEPWGRCGEDTDSVHGAHALLGRPTSETVLMLFHIPHVCEYVTFS